MVTRTRVFGEEQRLRSQPAGFAAARTRRSHLCAVAMVSFSLAVIARGQAESPAASRLGDNAVLIWDEATLQAVRDTRPGPTIVARALAIVHTAMFDAWAAYDPVAVPTQEHSPWRRPPAEATQRNKAKAVSFAAYRALVDLFPTELRVFDAKMAALGYDPRDASGDLTTPSGIGTVAAEAVIAYRHGDGSNQLGDLHPGAYSDYTGYVPVNPPDAILDPNRWQPLLVTTVQVYTTPQWGLVTPFALTSGSQLRPAGPARYPAPEYRAQADEIIVLTANLSDLQKCLTEYFADGPFSEFPPGHWALFAQFVSRRDGHTLDQDVRLFFALGNALLDASICAWDAKRAYDSERPITAIHFLYTGQPIPVYVPFQGTQTIDGANWRPYQLPSVVTPPFPEFFSGHSIFSAAGAEILKTFTGSDAFGFSVFFPAGSSSAEPGLAPSHDLTISFATFSDAADQAGMSRRYGGIHFAQGDLVGRALGRQVGALAWAKASAFFSEGPVERVPIVPTDVPRPTPRSVERD